MFRTAIVVFLLLVSSSNVLLAEQERPNILFCIADDWSWPHASAYGCKWVNTPGFDRVANDGILFHNAYTPNAKCAPSRSCLLTGRNSWQLEEAANHVPQFPTKFKTYPEALNEAGYHVGFTGKGWAPGKALTPEGKRRELLVKSYSKRKTTPPAKMISSNDYAANFDDFLAAAEEGQPWCFWYGATEPHRAYEYGAGVNKGGKSLEQIDQVPPFWPDNDVVRNDLLDYAFEIEYFDQHLVKMLNRLEALGQLENTLVIVTADNGMPFPRVKGQEYEHSNHLPLAMMWAKGIQGTEREVKDYISFVDLASTYLEIAGVDWTQSGMATTPGRSLVPIFESGASGQIDPSRDHVLIGKERHDIGRPNDWGYPIRGIVSDEKLYLVNYEPQRWPAGNPETGYLNTDGGATKTEILQSRKTEQKYYWEWSFGLRPEVEMFDLKKDPWCLQNLANDPEHQQLAAKMKARMEAGLKQQKDPRVLGNGGIFETYEYMDPRTKGFHKRFTSGEKMKAGWVNPSDFETEPIPATPAN